MLKRSMTVVQDCKCKKKFLLSGSQQYVNQPIWTIVLQDSSADYSIINIKVITLNSVWIQTSRFVVNVTP